MKEPRFNKATLHWTHCGQVHSLRARALCLNIADGQRSYSSEESHGPNAMKEELSALGLMESGWGKDYKRLEAMVERWSSEFQSKSKKERLTISSLTN